MVPSIWPLALATLFTVVAATARLPNVIPRPSIPVFKADHTNRTDVHGTPLPRLDTVYYFNQLIDHQNPQLGTFRERFWMSWEFYQPGRSSWTCLQLAADAVQVALSYFSRLERAMEIVGCSMPLFGP